MNEGSVPVIGVGASAGGLEAIREMFAGHNGRTGMAFVVVQHLDPTHESLMAQLIERYTTMKVKQIEGGEALEPDHIYVIPPGHGIAVTDNYLELTEFADPRGMRRPIDDFFESLAHDRQSLSSCVILSGTGADGSRGLRAVKEFGGLAIAQEPETARYDGMPVSAVGTGLVDLVLAPSDIIEALGNFFDRRIKSEEFSQEAENVTDHIDNLCDAMKEAVGHDFSRYKRATLIRRISRRMQVLSIEDAGEYVERIRSDSDECEALFRDLLINVTRFYRDVDEFEALDEQVIDRLVSHSQDSEEIRVWVPGCSSGEEAYTIAMMFAEAMRRHKKRPYVNVFATDIDDKMLAIAREAVYPLSALKDIPQGLQDRYTIGSSDHFIVVPQIRDMVRFSLHNLVRDPPFAKINLISCRNLLIYFDDTLQKHVLPLFHFALTKGGYLFLGSSETIGRFEDLFKTVDQKHRIFMRNEVKSRYTPNIEAIRPKQPVNRRSGNASGKSKPQRPDTRETVLNRIANRYAPATLLVDDEGFLLDRWGSTGKFLTFPDRKERNLHAPSLALPGLREVIGPILRKTIESGDRNITRDVGVQTEFGILPCTVICEPIDTANYLIIVRENGALQQFSEEDYEVFDAADGQLHFLEEELQETRYRLRTTVEELETTNEELKSSNEEMMSMNEELQSTNEELTTVNDELKTKVDQVTIAHSDLKNFFDTTELIVLVVEGNLQLRSFTEAAQALFPISERDVGRPLSTLPHSLEDATFVDLAHKAAENGTSSEYRAYSKETGREYIGRVIPYRRMDGSVDGATLVFTDVTDALQLERELREERERLRLALEVAKIGIWEYEPTTDRTRLDETERRLFDMDEDEDGARLEPILAKMPAEDRDRINNSLRRAMDGEHNFDETFRIPLRDGSERWLHGLGRRIVAGNERKFIGVTYDVTSEQRIIEQRELMVREMNHRIKNLFAVIAAMVSICRRSADGVDDFAENLRSRIHALARSHALSHNNPGSQGTDLRALVETVTAPSKAGQTIDVEGEDVAIAESQLTSLALILHEWATNSAKYGALSVDGGRIDVTWSVADGRLALNWKETGKSQDIENEAGFGTKLVSATAQQLRGEIEGGATADGYERTFVFPVNSVDKSVG